MLIAVSTVIQIQLTELHLKYVCFMYLAHGHQRADVNELITAFLYA